MKEFLFKNDPRINVVSKEEFEYRVDKVFELLWETLSRSFGPYGAPTIIYNYPDSHATKDGYTIMKNLSLDAKETAIDQAIADMAGDICGRLNYVVGDGTTSAIIATNGVYKRYRLNEDYFKTHNILPRDITRIYNNIKENIIESFRKKIKPIQNDDNDKMVENIRKVVYISSNGDQLITDYITDLYKELGTPAITCATSPDGITRKKLINGYNFNLILTDKLYINSDDRTMEIHDADIIILGTKVSSQTYEKILKPLNAECRQRGRNLIVAAPSYDERTMQQTIALDLNNEYRKYHKVNMVLTSYKRGTQQAKLLSTDFAMLMGTHVIDRVEEQMIIDQLDSGKNLFQVFNIDSRDIKGLRSVAVSPRDGDHNSPILYSKGVDKLPDGYVNINEDDDYSLIDNYVELGYVKDASLGLKTSQFTSFNYDEEKYKAVVTDAKERLDDAITKYAKLGTFNVEVNLCQQRYYALKLKMGLIEVGGDSEMATAMLKDSVDDAIKAASSAYNNGIVQGCNLTLIQTIEELLTKSNDEQYRMLLNILYEGFKDVYRTVICNAYDDVKYSTESELCDYIHTHMNSELHDVFTDKEKLLNVIDKLKDEEGKTSLIDTIIEYSILSSQVFDVTTNRFSNDVINSAQTDQQILTAVVDLIGLLIVGNQMVITQKHNF